VTCVITSYNRKELLQKALDSVLAQTYPVAEIIVMDDASSDDSRQLIQAYESKYTQVRGIIRSENVGVSRNRHDGIIAAKSDWVTTLDGDDEYDPGKIEAEVRAIEGDYSLAYSDTIVVTEQGSKRVDVSYMKNLKKADFLFHFISRTHKLPRDLLFSKQLYLDVGGFDLSINLMEDWEIRHRLILAASACSFSGAPGTNYNRHGTGLSSGGALKALRKILYCLSRNRSALIACMGLRRYCHAISMHVFVALKRSVHAVCHLNKN